VSTLEKEVQNIKDHFNKKIMSIMGSKIGKDNELCFLSFKNKKQKVLDKQFKGYGGLSELVCNLVITFCYVFMYGI
jgi:hypothetical protein